eukprot:3770463-Ditylum_brightwellii.AAC.2
MAVACYVGRYVLSTMAQGVASSSDHSFSLTSFFNVPFAEDHLAAFCDANWGPQDQSQKSSPIKIPLEKLCSVGPITWGYEHQTATALSICEAEVCATNTCSKDVIHLRNVATDLSLPDVPCSSPVFNDGHACVDWCKNSTTKGMRYLNMKENFVREWHQSGDICIAHMQGKLNVSDISTKEKKDTAHFIQIRDHLINPAEAGVIGGGDDVTKWHFWPIGDII